MFQAELSDTIKTAEVIQAEPSRLSEETGFFAPALAGFKHRAVESIQEPGESLARSVVSMGVGAAIAIATRGKGLKTSMALGASAAAGLQTAWSLAFDNDSPAESTATKQPFLSRLGNQLGETTYDAIALGALPGMLGAGATGKAMNYFELGAAKNAIPGLVNEAPLGRATTIAGQSKSLIPTGLENSSKLGSVTDDALKLKADLVPLNAWSRSGEQIGRDISNFGHTPFFLDGKKYQSVEGFYSGLLYNDPVRRAKIAEMWGLEAKIAGRSSNLQLTRYGKETIKLGSPDHHNLIERALRAKFDQNPQLKAAFIETHPRPIIHDTGAKDKIGAHFPREILEGMLTKIREEYVAAQKLLGR